MVGPLVEHHIVDGDVEGMLRERSLDLVGVAHQMIRALQLLMHLDHIGEGVFLRQLLHRLFNGSLLFLCADAVADYLLLNLDTHKYCSL